MNIMNSDSKIFYPYSKAIELSVLIQKTDPDWIYVARKESDDNEYGYIEVLDHDGYFLGYV